MLVSRGEFSFFVAGNTVSILRSSDLGVGHSRFGIHLFFRSILMNQIRTFRLVALTLALLGISCPSLGIAGSISLTTLASFDGINGANPAGNLLIDSTGNLFGTTHGATPNSGSVYEIAAGTHAVSTLYSFSGPDGAGPNSGLIKDASGNLYGTTSFGGAQNVNGDPGYGTVFEVSAGTNTLSTLYSFTGGSDGGNPMGNLIFDASGNLYGTTSGNYGESGSGTVFEIAAGTHALTTLVNFDVTNGVNPVAGLVADADGNLYGTTVGLGAAGSYGTVFEIASVTHTLSTLYSFTGGSDGFDPQGGLIVDSHGNIFGTTVSDGTRFTGTVFEIEAGTHTFTTLVSFGGVNGANPAASLLEDANGNLFGTTHGGGSNGLGTVFEIDSTTHALTTLISFNGTNGEYPTAGLVADANGVLYGTTSGVGNNLGSVFQLSGTNFAVPETSSFFLEIFGMMALAIPCSQRIRRSSKRLG